jgi:hypothetical protein
MNLFNDLERRNVFRTGALMAQLRYWNSTMKVASPIQPTITASAAVYGARSCVA